MRRISFSRESVLAIKNTTPFHYPAPLPLDPTGMFKWHTRRLVKDLIGISKVAQAFWVDQWEVWKVVAGQKKEKIMEVVPKYQTGETLAVAEALIKGPDSLPYYEADELLAEEKLWEWQREKLAARYMPVRVARLFIKVREIDLQRVNEIVPMDCVYEGLLVSHDEMNQKYGLGRWGAREEKKAYLRAYRELWDRLNSTALFRSGPWVWVYKFERVGKVL